MTAQVVNNLPEKALLVVEAWLHSCNILIFLLIPFDTSLLAR